MEENNENKKITLSFDSEGLAFPEVHTGKASKHEEEKKEGDEKKIEIKYDNMAFPEIKIHKQ